VTLYLTRGMQRPGVPPVGSRLVLVRRVPDPERIRRVRSAMAQKLAVLPWTHDHTVQPPAPRPRPIVLAVANGEAAEGEHDPLALLEVLR
jgi:hypothetical protein